jgi:hypothetical protein
MTLRSDEIRLKLIDSCKDADKPQCRALLIKLDKFWPEFTDHLKTLSASRLQLGEVLHGLRTLTSHRGNGQWGKYADAIGISSSTAKDLIADYERVAALNLPKHVHQATAEMGLDIAQRRYAKVLEFRAPELRKTETKAQARTALQEVKTAGKRKPQAKLRLVADDWELEYKQLLAWCRSSLVSLDQNEKVTALTRLVRDVLPGADITIIIPDNQAVMNA